MSEPVTASPTRDQQRPAPLQKSSESHSGQGFLSPPAFQLKADPVVQRKKEGDIYDQLCEQIKDAIYGLGTDEEAVYEALAAAPNINTLRERYQVVVGANMMADIRGDFGGEDLRKVISYFPTNYDAMAELLYYAMDGAGTDEDVVYNTLKSVTGNPSASMGLKRAYMDRYGVDLRTDIRGDFSYGAEEKAFALFGNEFEDMESYQEITGKTELGDYHWLKADRESQSGTWETAMVNMTRDEVEDVLQPFEQVRDYYIWVTKKLDEKGHESRWVKGALHLVDELSDTYDEGVTSGHWFLTPGKDVIPMLEDLNVGIVNFAIKQFNKLLYGELKDNPLQGEDAYLFDKDFIMKEQGIVAAPIYEQYAGTDAIEAMNNLFNGYGMEGNAVDAMTWAGLVNEVPTHPELINADLTDPESGYGVDARINVPLWMLYPDRHRSSDIDPENPAYPQIDSLMDQREIDPWHGDGGKDPHDVYESYNRVNTTIMENEWYEK